MAGEEPIKSEKLSFYLSFAPSDRWIAKALVDQIALGGRKVWPQWDNRWPLGSRWVDDIEIGVCVCVCVCVCVEGFLCVLC